MTSSKIYEFIIAGDIQVTAKTGSSLGLVWGWVISWAWVIFQVQARIMVQP